MLEQDARGVGADAEEHGMPEAQDAGVAQHQVIAHGVDGQDEDLDEHPLPELGRPGGDGLSGQQGQDERKRNQGEQDDGAEPAETAAFRGLAGDG